MPLPFRALLGFLAFGSAIVAAAYLATIADPVERQATIALPDWPAGAAPVRVVLLADIHFGNASMGPLRLHRIVAQVRALRPDLVVIAGDFLAGYDKAAAAGRSARIAAELATIGAPLGIVAVLGNHDEASDPAIVTAALRRAGIVVLKNEAVRKGPLVVGGLGDGYSGNARPVPTVAAMARLHGERLHGARLLVMHTPADIVDVPPDITLVLAGHTHCGQIVLPFYGAPFLPTVPARYACGLVTEGSHRIVITAGLGTSTLPFRIGAAPDLWVLTLGPPAR